MKNEMLLGVVLFILIFLIWISFPSILDFFFHSHLIKQDGGIADSVDVNTSGTFGDSYGILNSLFSGLAFAGIIVSIILQSRELKETRNELIAQKNIFLSKVML